MVECHAGREHMTVQLDPPVADDRQGQVGKGREVARGADRALRRHDGDDVLFEHAFEQLDDQPQLPLDDRAGYCGGGLHAVAQPVGPLGDHLVPQVENDTAGGQEGRMGSAQCVPPGSDASNLVRESEWGQRIS